MTPEGAFYSLHNLPSWTQYALASKSLVMALDVDDPEETVLLQLTISEASLMCLGLLVTSRLFPEFLTLAAELSTKVQDVSNAQGFLGKGDS